MGNIVEDVRTYLKTKAAITSLIGSGTAARIFLHTAKQGAALPYIVLDDFGGASAEHLIAISGAGTNRIQVDCYAATSAGAYTLAEAVRVAPLQMFRGAVGSSTVLSISSNGSYRRGWDVPSPGSGAKRYWCSRDYLILYREAVA